MSKDRNFFQPIKFGLQLLDFWHKGILFEVHLLYILVKIQSLPYFLFFSFRKIGSILVKNLFEKEGILKKIE